MSKHSDRLSTRLADAARFIAVNGWLFAVVGVPVTVALHAYSGLLLVVIIAVFWQLLAVFAVSALPPEDSAHTRVYRQMTRWGATYFAVTALFYLLSFYWGLNLLYLTASFLLSGLVCSLVLPRLTLGRTEVSWSAPAHIYAGDPFSVEVQLDNRNRVLNACALRISGGSSAVRRINRLAPGQRTDMLVRQSLPARGRQPLAPLTLRTAFPFGLFETYVINESRQDVLVYPHIGRIHDEALVRHLGGDSRWLLSLRRRDPQGEFHSLREYKHGDNPRHIHWPTSARLRKLFVREFERQQMMSVLLVLDAAMPPGLSEEEQQARRERLEKAISFSASLAERLARQNVFFAFASFCPELVTLPYDTGQEHLYALLEALALAEPSAEHGLGELAQALEYHGLSAGGVCLVTPGPVSAQEGASALGAMAHCAATVSVAETGFNECFTN
jgi:uncharacterized protein (DUF58 family)